MTSAAPTDSPQLLAALAYASNGWAVFPCHSMRGDRCSCGNPECSNPGKHPRTPRGLHDATTDENAIRDWWQRTPDANVAIRTGDQLADGRFLVVLDVDPRHHGDETLAAFEAQHGPMPMTWRAITGGGGAHYYLACSEPLRNSAGLVGDGLDIRGVGGYVLAPPSNHESGGAYSEDLGGAELGAPLANPPAWLTLGASRPVRVASALPADVAIIEGGRNDALASLAGTMRRRGFGVSAIFAALQVENRERCRPPLDDLELRRLAMGMSRYEATQPVTGGAGGPWGLLTVSDLSAELPPVPWVVKSLGMAPGALTMVAGYGYSRKTMAMQALGLSVAAGKPVWGVYRAEQGAFVHGDYEQGRRLTQERYQRLARGMGFDLRDLPAGSLKVACLPRIYLDDKGAADELMELCDGAKFVLIDSLRAAFPKADENSSEIRQYLDTLSRVSERTGACVCVIHHAKKPQGDSRVDDGEKFMVRGSSGIFDACQSVYYFIGDKDGPTKVKHHKDRIMGATVDDFGLTSVDLTGPGGDPRWALAVRHLELEQMAHAGEAQRDAEFAARVEAVCARMRTVFVNHPGHVPLQRRDLKALIRGKTDAFDAAWSLMTQRGEIVNVGSARVPNWSLKA